MAPAPPAPPQTVQYQPASSDVPYSPGYLGYYPPQTGPGGFPVTYQQHNVVPKDLPPAEVQG